MRAAVSVRHLRVEDLLAQDYDLVVAPLGYERRATSMAEKLRGNARICVAVAFDNNHCLDFDRNKSVFLERNFQIRETPDENVAALFSEILKSVATPIDAVIKVAVDVSSFTRLRFALFFEQLLALGATRQVAVSWYYCVAEHSKSDRDDLPFSSIGPVTSAFAGWSFRSFLPTSAIVGLGYEAGRALGALEQLQADKTWLLEPVSPIGEYSVALRRANDVLIRSVPSVRFGDYNVLDPFALFLRLESLVNGLLVDSRPAILPFGPKIFSLVSLFVASIHRDLSVWRASSGEPEKPINRLPSKYSCAIETVLAADRELMS